MTRYPFYPAAIAVGLALTACGSAAPRTRADLGAQADCRARADQAFSEQNRGAIYAADNYQSSIRDSPFATTGFKNNPGRGLPDEYAHEDMEQACLRGLNQEAPGTDIQATPGAVTGRPTPPPPATR